MDIRRKGGFLTLSHVVVGCFSRSYDFYCQKPVDKIRFLCFLIRKKVRNELEQEPSFTVSMTLDSESQRLLISSEPQFPRLSNSAAACFLSDMTEPRRKYWAKWFPACGLGSLAARRDGVAMSACPRGGVRGSVWATAL